MEHRHPDAGADLDRCRDAQGAARARPGAHGGGTGRARSAGGREPVPQRPALPQPGRCDAPDRLDGGARRHGRLRQRCRARLFGPCRPVRARRELDPDTAPGRCRAHLGRLDRGGRQGRGIRDRIPHLQGRRQQLPLAPGARLADPRRRRRHRQMVWQRHRPPRQQTGERSHQPPGQQPEHYSRIHHRRLLLARCRLALHLCEQGSRAHVEPVARVAARDMHVGRVSGTGARPARAARSPSSFSMPPAPTGSRCGCRPPARA